MGAMKPQAQAATLTQKEGQSPFFSVIVPVYNVAPYLGECLDSVLAQTFADWECLCTDDGSKDGSDLILDAYARRDPRFRITHQPNAGVSAARNRALDRLRGQWVGFLDGDDCYAKQALGQVYEMLRQNQNVSIEFVKWGYCLMGGGYYQGSAQPLYLTQMETIRFFIDEMIVGGMILGGLIRADAVGALRFPIGISMCEDTCFFAGLAGRLHGMLMIRQCAYYYRIHAGQATKRQGIRLLHDQLRAFRLVYQRYLSCVSGWLVYVQRLREVLVHCLVTEVTMHACYRGGAGAIGHEVRMFLRDVPLPLPKWSVRAWLVRLMRIPAFDMVLCHALSAIGALKQMFTRRRL